MNQAALKDIVDEALALNESLYLIELSISVNNKVQVVVDGDNGVLVGDCMYISRAIEHNIDREEHDFSLEVSSAGASAALTINRQFVKNIGRVLNLSLIHI